MRYLLAVAVAVLGLTACSGNEDPGSDPPLTEDPLTAETTGPVVFDDSEIQQHVGIEGPGDFLYEDDTLSAEYWFETEDGTGCPISEILSGPGEVDMAGPTSATNPAGTAGVEMYDSPKKATCLDALTQALADFPTGD